MVKITSSRVRCDLAVNSTLLFPSSVNLNKILKFFSFLLYNTEIMQTSKCCLKQIHVTRFTEFLLWVKCFTCFISFHPYKILQDSFIACHYSEISLSIKYYFTKKAEHFSKRRIIKQEFPV